MSCVNCCAWPKPCSECPTEPQPDDVKAVLIDYTNYKGRRYVRRILPLQLLFQSTPHHPEPQWLVKAYDYEKRAKRSFALKDIHSWKPGGGT